MEWMGFWIGLGLALGLGLGLQSIGEGIESAGDDFYRGVRRACEHLERNDPLEDEPE